jgi:hypothetical protein
MGEEGAMKWKLHRIRTRSRRKRLEGVLGATMRLAHETAAALDSAAQRTPVSDERDFLCEMAVRRRIDRLMLEERAAGMNLAQSALVPAPDGYPHAGIGRVAKMNSVAEIYRVTRRQTEAYIHQLQRMYVMDRSDYVRGMLGFLIRVEEDFVQVLDTRFIPGKGTVDVPRMNPAEAAWLYERSPGDPFVSGEAS